MKSRESIVDMYDRFVDIVYCLAYKGQPISDAMKVNKLLRGLSKQWNNIKTSLQKTQRIMPLSMTKLIGTLQSYETKQLNEENEFRGKKSIALKFNIDSDDILKMKMLMMKNWLSS